MTYQEFKRELYRSINSQEAMKGKELWLLEKGVEYTKPELLHMIRLLNIGYYGKENGRVREDIICVMWGRQERLHLLHWKVRKMFERYRKEGWQGILPEIASKLPSPPAERGMPALGDGSYEQSCERLMIRPVNYTRNQEQLQDCIYWKRGDIALELCALLYDSGDDPVFVKVNRPMTAQWGLPEEVLLTNAMLNSSLRMPPRLFHGNDMRVHHSWKEGIMMPEEKGTSILLDPKDYWEQVLGYRLTTAKRVNGAAAIFYPGVQERLALLLGGDYFVGFTSIHEAVVHPVRHKQLPDIKNAIRETNAVFDERETLTDSIYRYSTARKNLIEV